jgi:hypothetical protein
MNIWPSQPSASTRLASSGVVLASEPPALQNSSTLASLGQEITIHLLMHVKDYLFMLDRKPGLANAG